eukprot:9468415-Pyramimonas_sp.AAC.1
MNAGLDSKTAKRHKSDQGWADAPTSLPKGHSTTAGLHALRTSTPRNKRDPRPGATRCGGVFRGRCNAAYPLHPTTADL